MKVTLVTPPAVEPVSLIEAKSHLRVDFSDDDTLIRSYITAARGYVEQHLRRALVTQTWESVLDYWPATGRLMLPFPPLQSVTSVTYYDEDGASAVFASSNYLVDAVGEPGCIVLKTNKSWPTVTLQETNGVVVRFVAGYGVAADVPEAIKAAIKLTLGTLYENREGAQVLPGVTSAVLPFGVAELLMPYRNWK